MLKRFLFGIAFISLMTSCVSSKIYEALQSKYDLLKEENKSLLSQLNEGTNENSYSIKNLQNELILLVKIIRDFHKKKQKNEGKRNTFELIKKQNK